MNFIEINNIASDKQRSILFLQQRGILHNPRLCLNCGQAMYIQLRDNKGDRWRCTRNQCKTECGLRKGTWLENSSLPYRKVVLFLYAWSREMTSIRYCEHELSISKKTAIDWNNMIREVCAMDLLANPVVLGGPGRIVEVDESLFSKRKNHQGRVLPQQWVFGGIDRQTRECFLFAVPDRSGPTLLPIIQGSIRAGTTIMSDMWAAYGGIGNLGFTHLQVNHTYNFVDPATGAHTQNVENSWKNAKMRNKRQHGTHRQMLDSYLCEFMWRQRHHGNNDLFSQIIADIVVHFPPQ
jgi:transposase-like protein